MEILDGKGSKSADRSSLESVSRVRSNLAPVACVWSDPDQERSSATRPLHHVFFWPTHISPPPSLILSLSLLHSSSPLRPTSPYLPHHHSSCAHPDHRWLPLQVEALLLGATGLELRPQGGDVGSGWCRCYNP